MLQVMMLFLLSDTFYINIAFLTVAFILLIQMTLLKMQSINIVKRINSIIMCITAFVLENVFTV